MCLSYLRVSIIFHFVQFCFAFLFNIFKILRESSALMEYNDFSFNKVTAFTLSLFFVLLLIFV